MKLLLKVRLSIYFWVFLSIFLLASFFLPKVKFESTALTLFSVNSFLYGFYIAPILSAQKSRIEELHKIVRAESNALFAMALNSKSYSEKFHKEIIAMLSGYINQVLATRGIGGGEEVYEHMISESLSQKGKDADSAKKFLDQLIANQTNRSNLAMQISNKVYSNEWWIMFVLFSITLSFVLLLDTGKSVFMSIVKALLCTGLSMLILILVKLSSLTHKKATKMWDPLKKLSDTKFYRLD
jgi:hypothetical protein